MINQDQGSPLAHYFIGEAVQHILSTSHHGSVLASVTDAVYWLNEFGDLFWMTPMGGPMHQRCMQIVPPLPCFKVNTKYKIIDQKLITDSGEIFDFNGAKIWRVPARNSENIGSLSRSYQILRVVIDIVLAQHSPSGLSSLIPLIVQLASRENSNPFEINHGTIAEKAWLFIEGMLQAYWVTESNRFINSAKSLVGFGEGLTPSGDDFLGGFFYSRQLLSNHYPNAVKLAICVDSEFIHQAKPLTNLISYTILKDHANGHSFEPLHQLGNGLLSEEPVDQLSCYAERLTSIGHSTGWDILTGFLAGMSIAFTP